MATNIDNFPNNFYGLFPSNDSSMGLTGNVDRLNSLQNSFNPANTIKGLVLQASNTLNPEETAIAPPPTIPNRQPDPQTDVLTGVSVVPQIVVPPLPDSPVSSSNSIYPPLPPEPPVPLNQNTNLSQPISSPVDALTNIPISEQDKTSAPVLDEYINASATELIQPVDEISDQFTAISPTYSDEASTQRDLEKELERISGNPRSEIMPSDRPTRPNHHRQHPTLIISFTKSMHWDQPESNHWYNHHDTSVNDSIGMQKWEKPDRQPDRKPQPSSGEINGDTKLTGDRSLFTSILRLAIPKINQLWSNWLNNC